MDSGMTAVLTTAGVVAAIGLVGMSILSKERASGVPALGRWGRRSIRISIAAIVVDVLALFALTVGAAPGTSGVWTSLGIGGLAIAWLASVWGWFAATDAQGRGDERLPAMVSILMLLAILPAFVAAFVTYLQAFSAPRP